MKIHTVKPGEDICDIARTHGINERILRVTNEIDDNDKITAGEELLILTPTRTYTAKVGDDMTRVALRFGQTIGSLRSFNPHIMGEDIREGETVIIKYDARPYGMGTANGVYYKGCPPWKFKRALPYLTYLTVGAGVFDGKRISFGFDGEKIVRLALDNGKLPLLRVYDKSNGDVYSDKSARVAYIDSLIEAASYGGYGGITLGGENYSRHYEEFLIELRRRMIGQDMILMSEISPYSPISVSDFSDGAILSCDCECNKDALVNFAKDGESTKTLVEMPAFATCENGEYIETADAKERARRHQVMIESDELTNISSFCDKKYGRVRYNSLSAVKNSLDLIAELGYMGISFDIARTPLSYLMMYDTLFKSIGYANVDKRVKCNPKYEENRVI